MNWNSILIGILLTIHVIVSLFLVLIVMMQRPKSEGLGTAFGGGVTDTLFGSSAGNVLTKITTWLGVIFFVTTISLAYLYTHREFSSSLGTKMQTLNPPPAATTPSTNAPAAVPASTNSAVATPAPGSVSTNQAKPASPNSTATPSPSR